EHLRPRQRQRRGPGDRFAPAWPTRIMDIAKSGRRSSAKVLDRHDVYCTAMFWPMPISDQKVPISNGPPLVRFAVNLPCVFMPVMVTLPKEVPDNVAGNSVASAAAGTVKVPGPEGTLHWSVVRCRSP